MWGGASFSPPHDPATPPPRTCSTLRLVAPRLAGVFAMSKQPIFALVVALIVGFVAYLAYTGVTLRDVRNWFERQVGGRVDPKDIKTMPAGGYSPMVPTR